MWKCLYVYITWLELLVALKKVDSLILDMYVTIIKHVVYDKLPWGWGFTLAIPHSYTHITNHYHTAEQFMNKSTKIIRKREVNKHFNMVPFGLYFSGDRTNSCGEIEFQTSPVAWLHLICLCLSNGPVRVQTSLD